MRAYVFTAAVYLVVGIATRTMNGSGPFTLPRATYTTTNCIMAISGHRQETRCRARPVHNVIVKKEQKKSTVGNRKGGGWLFVCRKKIMAKARRLTLNVCVMFRLATSMYVGKSFCGTEAKPNVFFLGLEQSFNLMPPTGN